MKKLSSYSATRVSLLRSTTYKLMFSRPMLLTKEIRETREKMAAETKEMFPEEKDAEENGEENEGEKESEEKTGEERTGAEE